MDRGRKEKKRKERNARKILESMKGKRERKKAGKTRGQEKRGETAK